MGTMCDGAVGPTATQPPPGSSTRAETTTAFVHFHVVAPDGVFSRAADGAVSFHAGRAPSRDEIADIAGRVAKRMTKWTEGEYALFVERPEMLSAILMARRYGIDLIQLVDAGEAYALAARGIDAAQLTALVGWLRRTHRMT
jgi:hypothetical protein